MAQDRKRMSWVVIFITDIGIHDAVSDSSEELPLEVAQV
jgi:hypothetical protein